MPALAKASERIARSLNVPTHQMAPISRPRWPLSCSIRATSLAMTCLGNHRSFKKFGAPMHGASTEDDRKSERCLFRFVN